MRTKTKAASKTKTTLKKDVASISYGNLNLPPGVNFLKLVSRNLTKAVTASFGKRIIFYLCPKEIEKFKVSTYVRNNTVNIVQMSMENNDGFIFYFCKDADHPNLLLNSAIRKINKHGKVVLSMAAENYPKYKGITDVVVKNISDRNYLYVYLFKR